MAEEPDTDTATDGAAPATDEGSTTPRRGWGEWAIAGGLIVMSGVILWDGIRQPPSTSASGIGPGGAPIVVGSLMLVLAIVLCVQLARGRRGEAELAEGDVDVDHTKWVPLAVTVAALLFFIFTVELLGYIITSTVSFWLIAWAMGARNWWRNLLIAVIVSAVIYFAFTRLLEIGLPAGPLEGII